jgi:hypothetical protein
MQRELACYKTWFETHRPHQSLAGKTPREFYDGSAIEPAPVDRNHPIELVVNLHEGRRELPIVEVKNVA